MHPFPSPVECTVASALLLLSNTTPLSPPSNFASIWMLSKTSSLNLPVARRKRSKVNWISGHQRTVAVAPPEKAVEASTESGSCLSSTSSAACARNHHMKRKGLMMKPARNDEEPKRIRSRSGSGSRYLSRLAEAILKLLSSGCFAEMRIRQVLGDSPRLLARAKP
uniref:HTH three-helical bundle domain-containing protein n=1 Tax=Populus alba TaxID=43335 RepID=A0A4U5QL82_POPAL|nr:hypothetical protein D5086_0000090580 [Populus alba]